METLERKNQIATDWCKENNMIVNVDIFQAIIVKQNSDRSNQYTLDIDGNQVTPEKCVKPLGINIDNKLPFNEWVPSVCKKSSNEITVISRLHRYLGFKEKEVFINSFFHANFHHFSIIWHFWSIKFVRKIEQIEIRTLRILQNDFDNNCKTILDKSGKCTMDAKRLRTPGLKIFYGI